MKRTCARAMPVVTAILWTAACAGRPQPLVPPPRADKVETPTTAPAPREEQGALGGDATVEIAAPSYAIMDALCRPEAAWRVLPNVANIEDLGEEQGDLVWRMTHQFGVFSGGYVLRLRRDWSDDGHHTIRFWIDTRFERDVDDAWGYFHLEPLGPDRTKLHYHVRAVLLPGIIRWLFAEKIQWALMVVPSRAQAFLERERTEATRAE